MAKEYSTLRSLLRLVNYTPFITTYRNNRQAHILGMGPTGKMIGWWIGNTSIEEFDPDDVQWTQLTKYL